MDYKIKETKSRITGDNDVIAREVNRKLREKKTMFINLMGSHGQIRGNMEENRVEYSDFRTGKTSVYNIRTEGGGEA